MPDPAEDELEEQAKRIRRAEEDIGLKKGAEDSEAQRRRVTARGYRIGTDFVGTIIVCVAGGWGADWFFGWAPWAMMTGLALGFVVAVMNLMRAIGKAGEDGDGSSIKE